MGLTNEEDTAEADDRPVTAANSDTSVSMSQKEIIIFIELSSKYHHCFLCLNEIQFTLHLTIAYEAQRRLSARDEIAALTK
jgi:hypothetical protein